MQSARPACTEKKTLLERAKNKFRTALLAGSLLMPSAALAQERPPGVNAERPAQATHQEAARDSHREHEASEHRHPESERFSPGPLFILRSSTMRVRGALHEEIVNPRAVVPFSGGISATYNLSENTRPFFNYMLRGGKDNFPLVPLSLTVSAQYDFFRFRDLVMHRNAGTMREEEYPLTGDGHSASITPALTLGGGIGGVPIEIALYANFGYRNWDSQRTMRFHDGTSGDVGLRTQEPYFGLWGFEVRFPSVPCEATSPIRFERFGAAAFGEPQNLLGYFTLSANYSANHRHRLRTLLTPQVSNFGGELNLGGELIPIETTFYLRHGLISLSPGTRIERNFATGSLVLEAFGELRYFPAHEFGVAFRSGWIGDISGHHLADGEPSTPFGSLNFIFNFDSPGTPGYRPEIARIRHGG